jgi:hypothetical protein
MTCPIAYKSSSGIDFGGMDVQSKELYEKINDRSLISDLREISSIYPASK